MTTTNTLDSRVCPSTSIFPLLRFLLSFIRMLMDMLQELHVALARVFRDHPAEPLTSMEVANGLQAMSIHVNELLVRYISFHINNYNVVMYILVTSERS